MEEDSNKLVLPDPGALVAGRYRVVDTVGRGGCGVVFEARDECMGRDVALKVLSPDAARRVTSLARRFEREIDLVRRLEHPNIVRLYDFSRAENPDTPRPDGAPPIAPHWMAMELVRGVELRHAVDPDTGRMSPERVHHVVLQMLSGLTAAHQQGIVHRDLKPNNIMLCSLGADEDVVKILDFGIGRTLRNDEDRDGDDDLITHTEGTLLGTPRYMAPEVLLKKPPGPAADVYAVGLMMLELLTGRRAVEGKDVYEVVARQLSEPLAVPDWLRNSPLGPVLARATDKSADRRYPTAREFHEALRQAPITRELLDAFHAQDDDPATAITTDRLQRGALPTRPVDAPGDDTGRGLEPRVHGAPRLGDPLDSEPLLAIDAAAHTPVDLPAPPQPALTLEAATATTSTPGAESDAPPDDPDAEDADDALANALELPPQPAASPDDPPVRATRPHARHTGAAAMRFWLRGLPALLATALMIFGLAAIRWSHADDPPPAPDPAAPHIAQHTSPPPPPTDRAAPVTHVARVAGTAAWLAAD